MDFLRKKAISLFIGCLFVITNSTVSGQTTSSENEGKMLEVVKMEKKDYRPEIHGTIRGKYEYAPIQNAHRFQVRNARFSLTGNIHPIVAYKAEIDLSDEGVTKMLDAYVRIFPVKGLFLTLGQMKIPFGIDNFRPPHTLFFANRAFLSKQVSSLRDVGFTIGYKLTEKFPFSVEAGIFNGSGLYEQKKWQKQMNYATQIKIGDPEKYQILFSAQAIHPDQTYMYLYNTGAFFKFFGFHIEAEYLYKEYKANAFKPVNSLSAFINYDLKLPKVFHKISFLTRYDIMTDNSRGFSDKQGLLTTDDFERQRITSGITLSIAKPFFADIRINYEKYFYSNLALAKVSEQDKLVFEIVARF